MIAASVIAIRKRHASLHDLAPQKPSSDPAFDVSISSDGNDRGELLDAVPTFLREHRVPSETADRVRLACEELTAKILTHGLEHDSRRYLDVLVRIEEGSVVFIGRDDGAPFDPIQYNGEGIGLLLVRRICTTIGYSSTIGQNTVTASFSF